MISSIICATALGGVLSFEEAETPQKGKDGR